MKIWCYLAQGSVNKRITWLNKCLQHVIRFKEVWQIGCKSLINNLGLKNQDEAATKEYNNSDSSCGINIRYFLNTSPSSISNLVLYQAVNNILAEVGLIKLGVILHLISTSLTFYFGVVE